MAILATTHHHSHVPDRFAVLPTPLRLRADAGATGRGVTIAFVDSGFAWHPDLAEPTGRVAAFVDLDRPGARLTPDLPPGDIDWHGTQAAVVG